VIGRQHGLSEDRRKMPLLKKQRRYSPSRGSGLSSGGDNNIVYGGAHNLLRSRMEGRKDDGASTKEDEGCCGEESGSDCTPEEDNQSNRDLSPAAPETEEVEKEFVPVTALSMGTVPPKFSLGPLLPNGNPSSIVF